MYNSEINKRAEKYTIPIIPTRQINKVLGIDTDLESESGISMAIAVSPLETSLLFWFKFDFIVFIKNTINKIKGLAGFDEDELIYIKEFKSKTKLSFSNIGKISHLGTINECFELLEYLKNEKIYAVLPYSYKIY